MAKLYFKNVKTGKRYEVIRFDKETGDVILKGPHSEFREKFDKERFKQMGYVLEQEETTNG